MKEYGDCRNEGCLGNLKPEYENDGLVFFFCHVLDSNLIGLDVLLKMSEKEEKDASGIFPSR